MLPKFTDGSAPLTGSTGSIADLTDNVNSRYQLRSVAEVEQEVRDLKRERTALQSRARRRKIFPPKTRKKNPLR